jgi:hypothetical protein
MNTAFVTAKQALATQRTSSALVPTIHNEAIELIKTAVSYEPGDDLVRSGWYDKARAYLRKNVGWP